jgi:copper chaperone CopZ
MLRTFLEPVNVFPSEEQINMSSRYVLFSNISSPINNTCPITHEQFTEDQMVLELICRHVFNNDAIRIWFQTNVRCPVCRYDIRTNVSNVDSDSNVDSNIDSDSNSNIDSDSNRRHNEAITNANNAITNANNTIRNVTQSSMRRYNNGTNSRNPFYNTSSRPTISDISSISLYTLSNNNLINNIFNYIRNDISFNDIEDNITMEYTFMTPETDTDNIIPINRRVIHDDPEDIPETNNNNTDDNTRVEDYNDDDDDNDNDNN